MDRQLCLMRAALLMEKYKLTDWRLAWMTSTRFLGRCYHSTKEIHLSSRYVELNEWEAVQDTVLHEIAHALVGPGHEHDEVWRAFAVAVGARPSPCAENVVSAAQYRATCGCGTTFLRHGRPRKRWICPRCRAHLDFVKGP